MSKKKITFDVDDILWSLNKKMTEITGIDYNKLTVYSSKSNPLLTANERKRALHTYGTIELYENINWHDGITRINNINAAVHINSNCLSEDIANMKRKQLQQILNIPDSNMKFNVITMDKSTEKVIDADTYIFVDDSPYNISASPAAFNIMLKCPWNTSEISQKLISDNNKKVIMCDSLNDIISIINKILESENDFYEYKNYN